LLPLAFTGSGGLRAVRLAAILLLAGLLLLGTGRATSRRTALMEAGISRPPRVGSAALFGDFTRTERAGSHVTAGLGLGRGRDRRRET
jgi:hypothetical protein